MCERLEREAMEFFLQKYVKVNVVAKQIGLVFHSLFHPRESRANSGSGDLAFLISL